MNRGGRVSRGPAPARPHLAIGTSSAGHDAPPQAISRTRAVGPRPAPLLEGGFRPARTRHSTARRARRAWLDGARLPGRGPQVHDGGSEQREANRRPQGGGTQSGGGAGDWRAGPMRQHVPQVPRHGLVHADGAAGRNAAMARTVSGAVVDLQCSIMSHLRDVIDASPRAASSVPGLAGRRGQHQLVPTMRTRIAGRRRAGQGSRPSRRDAERPRRVIGGSGGGGDCPVSDRALAPCLAGQSGRSCPGWAHPWQATQRSATLAGW